MKIGEREPSKDLQPLLQRTMESQIRSEEGYLCVSENERKPILQIGIDEMIRRLINLSMSVFLTEADRYSGFKPTETGD
jgi:hypothetical protein